MNLLKSLAVTSLIVVFSRILGFARDSVIAKIFGAGIETDAFFIAFKLPNSLRRIFSEGAFSQAFVPMLIAYKNNQNDNITRNFIAYVAGFLIFILLIVTFMGMIIAPWILMIVAPGFIKIKSHFFLTTKLLRITFPYIFLISLTSLAGAILNAWYCFYSPAFSSIFLNISMISFSLFAAPYFSPSILSLAWATIVGGIFQLMHLLFYLQKIRMLVLPKIDLNSKEVMQVVKKIGPAIFGVSVSQVSFIINTIYSSFLISGSISWMYYADRLTEFPLGILGATLGSILLPLLSKSSVTNNHEEYCHLLDWGLRLCFLLALPSTIALAILAKPLIISLFQYGKFTEFDVLMTQKTLIVNSVGLLGLSITKVLTSGFYSYQDVKTPIKISIITLVATQVMNFLFIYPLKHIGLSLSISLSAYLHAFILYKKLYQKGLFVLKPRWKYFFLRLFVSLLVLIIVLIGLLYIMPKWSFGSMTYRLLRLIFLVIIGSIAYFLTLIMLGFKLKEFILYIV